MDPKERDISCHQTPRLKVKEDNPREKNLMALQSPSGTIFRFLWGVGARRRKPFIGEA